MRELGCRVLAERSLPREQLYRPLQEANRSFSRYFRFAAKSFSKVYKQDRGTYPVSLKGPRSQRVLRRGPTEQKQQKLPCKCAQTFWELAFTRWSL